MVSAEAFPSVMGWDDFEALSATLWSDEVATTIRDAVDARAVALGEVTRTVRKSYTAWSRKVQFAAARPLKGGGAMLGLAVPMEADLRLLARGSQSWSKRLTARLELANVEAVDDGIAALLRRAWESA